jgi:hypothetical protein
MRWGYRVPEEQGEREEGNWNVWGGLGSQKSEGTGEQSGLAMMTWRMFGFAEMWRRASYQVLIW